MFPLLPILIFLTVSLCLPFQNVALAADDSPNRSANLPLNIIKNDELVSQKNNEITNPKKEMRSPSDQQSSSSEKTNNLDVGTSQRLELAFLSFSQESGQIGMRMLDIRYSRSLFKASESVTTYAGIGGAWTQFQYTYSQFHRKNGREENIGSGIYLRSEMLFDYRGIVAAGLRYSLYLSDGILIDDSHAFDDDRLSYAPQTFFSLILTARYLVDHKNALGILLEKGNALSDFRDLGFGVSYFRVF